MKKAFELGEIIHRNQKRKSGEPYFTHPIAVAVMLSEIGADADTIIAALLHDAVEDTPLTLSEINQLFNGTVTSLIDGVTKLPDESFAEQPNMDTQIETLRKMFTLMQQDVRIMVIKLCDRLHNMRTVDFLAPERRITFAQETMDVYVKIADRLSMQDLSQELEELCLRVLNPIELEALSDLREQNLERGESLITKMQQKLLERFPSISEKTELVFERKSWEKLRFQLEAQGVATGVSSLTVAFVSDSLDSCYQILGALHQLWHRETLSFQDYINSPSINGYQGLHTTIILSDGTRVRCKIRTVAMYEYAHRGIAMYCFQTDALGIDEYLPWTKRIHTLTEDTRGHSEDFFESLQSDILGESIMIHGQGDQAFLLPKGSTALDGVFYIFGKNGLYTTEILVNGKQIPFHEELVEASTISAVFDKKTQAKLEWLEKVRTGVAQAEIRQQLTKNKPEAKAEIGQTILQEYLNQKHRGFLSEFTPGSLKKKLNAHGYQDLKDIYLQIAEGRLQPQQIDGILFNKSPKSLRSPRTYTLDYVIAAIKRPALFEILVQYKVLKLKIDELPENQFHFTVDLLLNEEQYEEIVSLLRNALIGEKWNIKRKYYMALTIGSIGLLFTVWGLDPVVAHFLLAKPPIEPLDLAIVRFWSLSVMSGILLLFDRARSPLSEARLSLNRPSLWLSAILLFFVALSSYFSLVLTLPAHYTIPMTAAGVLVTSVVNWRRWKLFILTWTLLIGSTIFLIINTPEWSWFGVLCTLVAVVTFSLFSIVNERYKKLEQVEARSSQYFFLLSIICAVMSLPLIASSNITALSSQDLTQMVLFSIVFSGLPYYMYYFLLSHRQLDFVLRNSFLMVVVTGIGQQLFVKELSVPTLIASGLVMIAAILPLLKLSKPQTTS